MTEKFKRRITTHSTSDSPIGEVSVVSVETEYTDKKDGVLEMYVGVEEPTPDQYFTSRKERGELSWGESLMEKIRKNNPDATFIIT